MSPTCSSRFFTGRNTRSDAALTTTELLPGENYPCSPENTYAKRSLWHADRVRQREPSLAQVHPEPARRSGYRWYVRRALRALGVGGCGSCARGRAACLLPALCLLATAGCGGGERQDENEREGNFPVEVVEANFPENQKLAKSSDLVVTVRNAGDET